MRHCSPAETRATCDPDPDAMVCGQQTRRRVRLFGAVAVVLSAAIGFGIGLVYWFPKTAAVPSHEALIVAVERALAEIQPTLSPPYAALVREASAEARRVVASYPGDVRGLAALANVAYLAHSPPRETDCWRRSLDLAPAYLQAYSRLGALAMDRGDFLDAERWMRQGLSVDPANAEFAAILGSSLTSQRKPAEAVEVLERTVQATPTAPTPWFILGQAYLQLEDFAEARDSFLRATELLPTYTHAFHGLATACARLGEKEAARKYQERFAELKAEDAKRRGETTRSLEDDRLAPEHVANVMAMVGLVDWEQGDAANAERCWRRGSALNAANTACREGLANLYQAQGRVEDALRTVEELRGAEPSNAAHHMSAALVYARMNRFGEAEAALMTYCQMSPRSADGYAALAQLYCQAGQQLAEARSLAQAAVELEPSARNFQVLAAVLEKNGDQEGARAARQRAAGLAATKNP
jgi:tetratricopeptide (TPR) repeat protein